MFRLILLLIVAVFCAPHLVLAQERVALLIANQSYRDAVGPLQNPHNDIEIVGAALKQAGFKVLPYVRDAKRIDMLSAIRKFAEQLRAAGPKAVGFFYYSGHGAAETEHGPNYLIPVDVESTASEDLWDASVSLTQIIRRLKRGAPEAAQFIVFDACRNELRLRSKSLSKGFVPVANRPGTFIAFATAPNTRATDEGKGAGLYASALAEEILKPGQDHLNLFFNVKQRIASKTGQIQIPWDRNGLLRRVHFSGEVPPAQSKAPQSDAALAWSEIRNIEDVAVLDAFIARFPKSIFTVLAKARRRELTGESKNLPSAKLIASIQQGLKRAGCYAGPVDNLWGPGSRAGLQYFLQAAKLPVNDLSPTNKILAALNNNKSVRCFLTKPIATSSTKTLETVPKKRSSTTGHRCRDGNMEMCQLRCKQGSQRACQRLSRGN